MHLLDLCLMQSVEFAQKCICVHVSLHSHLHVDTLRVSIRIGTHLPSQISETLNFHSILCYITDIGLFAAYIYVSVCCNITVSIDWS